MYAKHRFQNVIKLFSGMNIVDTPDVLTKKGQSPYILNCYNAPEGGIAKLFGRSKHNSVALGANAELTGLYQLDAAVPAFYAFAEAKFYKDNNGTWVDKTGAVTITDDKNNLWTFTKFEDLMIATSLMRDAPIEHDGGAGNAAAVSGMPAGKFSAVLAHRLFSFSTAAEPKLAYYSDIDDRTTWPALNFLNFNATESDNEEISAVGEHLNAIIVGKNNSIFRLYHTGTTPPFQYYTISKKQGIPAPLSVQTIPAVGGFPERLIWMGYDGFYQLTGDDITPIAEDIKAFWSENAPFQVNLSRIQYAVSGIIREKNLYFCAFTSGSGSTNDYMFVLDYKNMQWGICDFVANCFGSRLISNRKFLYSGTYNGFAAKHDPAVFNNLGVKYNSSFYFPWIDFGNTQIEKQIEYLIALFDATGKYTFDFEYRTNLGSDSVAISTEVGADLLGVDFILGSSQLGGVELVEVSGEIMKRFKRIQFLFQHDTIDENFRLFAAGFLWKPCKGYRIS